MAVLRYYGLILLAAILLVGPVGVPIAEAAPLKLYEKKIQSGLVYHFLKNTNWPESLLKPEDMPLYVCMYGSDPFEGYLNPIAGKTAQKRTIRLRKSIRMRDLTNCHAVIIGNNKTRELREILLNLQNLPVLTMSNIVNFNKLGGMIEFGSKKNNIAVYVNDEAVRQSGLNINDRMLALAEAR